MPLFSFNACVSCCGVETVQWVWSVSAQWQLVELPLLGSYREFQTDQAAPVVAEQGCEEAVGAKFTSLS